eukprot:gene28284-34152_t
MARANLLVDEQVNEKFLAAQESRSVRLILLKIVNESIVFHDELSKQSDAAEDFNTILPSAFVANEASFGLFNVVDDVTAPQAWCLVVWIPEECRVRDKMLYSSSREDLRKKLGLGYFKADYPANQYEDLTWDQYQSSLDKNFDIDVLTENERLVLEEKVLASSESTLTKATALGIIPFALSEDVQQQLAAFKAGDVNWLEMNVANEVVQLINARTVGEEGGYAQYLDNSRACFVAAKLTKADGTALSCFIYFCPEETPVRAKMTMSSSKASVLAAAGEHNVAFDKFLEARGVEEIDEVLGLELNPPAVDGNATTTSSSAAAITHAKPSRPGRGKAKVSKFQADDM